MPALLLLHALTVVVMAFRKRSLSGPLANAREWNFRSSENRTCALLLRKGFFQSSGLHSLSTQILVANLSALFSKECCIICQTTVRNLASFHLVCKAGNLNSGVQLRHSIVSLLFHSVLVDT